MPGPALPGAESRELRAGSPGCEEGGEMEKITGEELGTLKAGDSEIPCFPNAKHFGQI